MRKLRAAVGDQLRHLLRECESLDLDELAFRRQMAMCLAIILASHEACWMGRMIRQQFIAPLDEIIEQRQRERRGSSSPLQLKLKLEGYT